MTVQSHFDQSGIENCPSRDVTPRVGMRYLSFVRTLIDAEDRGAQADRSVGFDRLVQETSGQVLPCVGLKQAAAINGLLSSAALRIRFGFPSMPLFGHASCEREYPVLHLRSV